MKYGDYYVSICRDRGIEREDAEGNRQVCDGYFCQVYSDEEMTDEVDCFCLAIGHEIPDDSDESIEAGIRYYLGISMDVPVEEQYNSDPKLKLGGL